MKNINIKHKQSPFFTTVIHPFFERSLTFTVFYCVLFCFCSFFPIIFSIPFPQAIIFPSILKISDYYIINHKSSFIVRSLLLIHCHLRLFIMTSNLIIHFMAFTNFRVQYCQVGLFLESEARKNFSIYHFFTMIHAIDLQ